MSQFDPDFFDLDDIPDVIDFLRPYIDQLDGPPESYMQMAKAAFAMRDLDGQLAELLHDSSLAALPAGVRSTTLVRTMTFDLGAGVVAEIEFLADRLVGEIDGGCLTSLEWHTTSGQGRAALVEADHFELAGVPQQSFYLVFEIDGRRVASDWLLH